MTKSINKGQYIPSNRMQQWQKEVKTWKKSLISRMEENVWLKNKIAEILKNDYIQNCLEEIEEFQTESILVDEITGILRMEITELDHLLNNKNIEKSESEESLGESINHLKKDMAHSENRFNSLISAFWDFQQKICTDEERSGA